MSLFDLRVDGENELRLEIPRELSAYWLRMKASVDCVATCQLVYS